MQRPDVFVRATHRLTPLALCIGLSLGAHAFAQDASQQMEDLPDDFTLCPIVDAVPPFADIPAEGIHLGNADRSAHPTDIEGDVLSGTDVAPQFEGNVALRRGDQFLGADKLSYDSQNQRYVAEGDIRYQDNTMRMTAERAEGNQAADEHRIEDLKYQLVSRRGNGESDVIELHGAQGVLRGSTYSTCDPTDRHWELRARRIDVDSAKGFATAKSAVLRVGKVPVLYVPWFMFPIDERRHTGLLFPSLSNSDRNGFDYKQPVYLNLAPNYDATLYPRIMTDRGELLGVEGRYLGRRGQATLSGAYINDDDLRPEYGARGHGAFNGFYNLSRNWQARANLLHISDPRYFEDFNSSIAGIAVYNAHSAAGLFGRGRNWVSSLSIDRYQLADYTLSERSLPYDRLPRAYLSWDWRDMGWLEAGLDAEAVYFQKDDVVPVFRPGQPTTFDASGGARLDIKPYIAMPLSGASWFVKPSLAWRYTAYQLDKNLADFTRVPRTPTRSLPIASVDAGLFFDRATTLDGESYLQTLEPRLYYLHVPYRDQTRLPVFDTGALTFSWGQMFRDNRFSGGDRQADANQLTLALTSRLLRESDGKERLAVSLGQIRYFDDSLVTLPRQPPIEQGRSAWVADASWAPSDRWTIGASYQWNPTEREKDLLSVRGRYLLPDDGVVNLSYRFRRDVSEQTDFSFLYPINKTWSVVGRHYWSILDSKPLEQILGFQWDSCCVAVRLVGRRYVQNREGDLSRGIMLEIELKGLGSAGQDTRKTLRRAILGYNRGDLYLVPPETATAQPPDDPDNQP
jgi:LPS-assembly protein